MEICFLTEKKRDLARQLKEYEGESSSKKRPRAENSFVSTEEYQIALADAERNRQETLKFKMANNRNKAKSGNRETNSKLLGWSWKQKKIK